MAMLCFIYSKNEPLQKVVRISSKGQYMATGGTDGHIRLWKFPQLKKVFCISGHSNEVDDLDFNKKETQVRVRVKVLLNFKLTYL